MMERKKTFKQSLVISSILETTKQDQHLSQPREGFSNIVILMIHSSKFLILLKWQLKMR